MKYLIARLILMPIVLRDYRLRMQGRRPDRWHWADRMLVRLGYVVTVDNARLLKLPELGKPFQ